MIILKLKNKEYLLKENINLNKKMIQCLISLMNQTSSVKYIDNNFYYKLKNFKNWIINIINVMEKLIHDISNIIHDKISISQVKLACVHAIIDDMDERNIGDCGDTSVNLNIKQLLYYYINNIMQIVIDFCLNIQNILMQYQTNSCNKVVQKGSDYEVIQMDADHVVVQTNILEILNNKLINCITQINNILNFLYNISIQNLSPISKKFNYNLVNKLISDTVKPLLTKINNIYYTNNQHY